MGCGYRTQGEILYRNKTKRGISSILAAVFMIGMIVVGLNVMIWALELQNDFSQALTERSLAESERINEKIELKEMRIDNDKINMTVVNTGSIPVKLVSMWVTNTTDTDGWHRNYSVSELINPGESTNVGQALPLSISDSSSYRFKLITERGNLANFQVVSPKDKALSMNLFAIPPSIPTGQNLTMMFGVTNNLTDGSIVKTITPTISWTKIEAPEGTITATATLVTGPIPTSEESLLLGETAFFKWVYRVVGDKGDTITFNATIADARQGNYIIENTDVVIDTFAEQATTALSSLGISLTPPSPDNVLHFHKGDVVTLPNHKMLHSISPGDVSPGADSNEFNTPGETMYWITNNSTDTISMLAGEWNYTIWGKKGGGGATVGKIDLKLERTDVNANPLATLWTTTLTTTSGTEQAYFISKSDMPAVNLAPQERLMVTVTWVEGKFKMWFDKDDTKDSYLTTTAQNPPIPIYLVYSGGELSVRIKNNGVEPIWIDNLSRVTFEKISTGAVYGGLIKKWDNETDANPAKNIDQNHDSGPLLPTGVLLFTFSEPKEIPGDPGDGAKLKDDLGTYNTYIRLSGYDKAGAFIIRVISVGSVVV